MPQAQPRHQLKLQDNQMLQRQLLLKQLQELQKQNYLNQQSEIFMPSNTRFLPHGISSPVQGYANGNFSQPQTQDRFLANNYDQYSHLQGLSSDSTLAFTKGSNNQEEKPSMLSLNGKPFYAITQNMPPDLQSFADGPFQSKQFPNGKNLFGQVSPQVFNCRQDQTGPYEQFQGKTTKIDPSQGETTLDPLEQKILFNMDGNSWSSSFGMKTEGYTNKLECSDYLSSFSSIQSGSWSALMQSAVGESSSDNGTVQEEWSGLSYQNTELSMDNQHSNNADVGNQQTVDNNATTSLNCQLQAPLGGTNMSSGFSGFQFPKREGTRSDSSHESVQQSPKVATQWLDDNSQQGQLNHSNQPPSGNAFPFQGFQLSDCNAERRSIFAKSHEQMSTPIFGSSMESGEQQGNQSSAGSSYTRNQHQMQYPAAVDTQSPQATLPLSNKFPPYVQASPGISQDQHEQKIIEGNLLNEQGPGLTNSQSLFHGKEHHGTMSAYQRAHSSGVSQTSFQSGLYHGLEPVAKHISEETDVDTGLLMGHPHHVNLDSAHGGENQMASVSARDFEAFGRSLKPSNLHANYSGSSEIKHEVGSVSYPGTSIFVNPYAYMDVNIQSVKPFSLPLLQNTAEEMGRHSLSFTHTDHNVSDAAFHRTDHSQVNTQMSSSFNQNGDIRNGQMLSMYENTANNSKYPSPFGKHLEMKTLIVPLDVTRDSKATVNLSPPSTLPSNFGNTKLSIITSRKRKTATSDLLPWHTDVTESSNRLHGISVAEMEWAKAVNRLIDKVDYEVKTIKDVHPLVRPKKRLVCTTQLMQMVFRPAPEAIFRRKATFSYDSLVYFSAKIALGDACNLNSWSRNGSGLPCTSDNMKTEESKPSEKSFSTIVEALISRAKNLEADLLRLDKTVSVLDAIMECKELEKFSMINRFARFHFRGQPKVQETSTSTSSGSTSSLLTPSPYRYVQALRPRALPDKAQCLAL